MSDERTFDPELQQYAGFVIDTDQKAEWALNVIREKRAEVKRYEDFYRQQLQKMNAALEGTEAYFSGLLREYFRSIPHHVTKTQESHKLPNGMALKLVKPKQTYQHDDAQLLTWAQASAPELIKVKQTFDWSAMKGRLKVLNDGSVYDTETAEVLPADLVRSVWTEAEFRLDTGKDDA